MIPVADILGGHPSAYSADAHPYEAAMIKLDHSTTVFRRLPIEGGVFRAASNPIELRSF
jgi:hypothetical protein